MKWRSEFGGGLDELVPTFEYTEKPQVSEYYPQYYHKTDKVTLCPLASIAQGHPKLTAHS